MKKVMAIVLCILLLAGFSVNALAVSEGSVITMQPQSHYDPEHSVAIYTVKATGVPWWALTLIALGGAGAGVGVAVILIRKNK